MRGLKDIVMHNTHAKGPAKLPDLGKGAVRTVIWSLFDEDGDFIRSYCTEVCTVYDRPAYVLQRAVCLEGFPVHYASEHAELDFVFNHAVEVAHNAHE